MLVIIAELHDFGRFS